MPHRCFECQRPSVTVTKKVNSTEVELTSELIYVVCGRSDGVISVGSRPFRAATTELVIEYYLITDSGKVSQWG